MKNEVIIGDCAEVLKQLPDESIDCIVTDPPYGYSFMGLQWDKALPSEEALRECCRVLKSGAFGFFMCAPRQDVLSRMIIRLEDAGFNIGFSSLFHAYASGFPKAGNASKLADRRLGAERELIQRIRPDGKAPGIKASDTFSSGCKDVGHTYSNIPLTQEAKALDGAYLGFQPKPALEVIITVMKQLSEKTYIDQALVNGKGVTWLGDCRIPYEGDSDIWKDHEATGLSKVKFFGNEDTVLKKSAVGGGRFPANLLVSDNILDNGINYKTGSINGVMNSKNTSVCYGKYNPIHRTHKASEGSFSRYFSLDAWWSKKISELPEEQQKTFPFLITPKSSKSEKNKYIENKHPTVKPLKLMSYLITMGSREGDVILDPFAGSGTTLEACKLLNRVFIGIDKDPENEKYMRARGQLDSTTLESFQEA